MAFGKPGKKAVAKKRYGIPAKPGRASKPGYGIPSPVSRSGRTASGAPLGGVFGEGALGAKKRAAVKAKQAERKKMALAKKRDYRRATGG